MQTGLPLSNILLRDLGCPSPTKREWKISVTDIWNISCKFQPQLGASSVQDKWKLFQADDDVSVQDTKEAVKDYWDVVLHLKSVEEINRYPSLQLVTL